MEMEINSASDVVEVDEAAKSNWLDKVQRRLSAKRLELRLVIMSYPYWKPYFYRYSILPGFECRWLFFYFNAVWK